MNLDGILERIRRLTALASSSNEHEAAAAAAKAQELMLKYQIEQSEIPSGQRENDPLEREFMIVGLGDWKAKLINGVANANGCKAIYHVDNAGMGVYTIVGHKSGIAIVSYLYPVLARKIDEFCAARVKEDGRRGKRWQADYCFGAAVTIRETLEAERRQATVASDSRALVLANDKAVTDFYKQLFPRTGNMRMGGHQGSGYGMGRADGVGIHASGGLSGGSYQGTRQLR